MAVLHHVEWGDPGAPALVCLHGVNAHARRFRRLAERLGGRFRVVAVREGYYAQPAEDALVLSTAVESPGTGW